MHRTVFFVLSLIACLVSIGCNRDSTSKYVNPQIAGFYQDFYDAGPMDPNGAKAALKKAAEADPDNAYTFYLRASQEAGDGDLEVALDTITKANGMKKTVIYVSAPPPEDSMQSLGRVRQLGFTTAKCQSLKDKQLDYFKAVRQMGRRIAEAEPISSLSVVNGVGILRKSLQSEQAYWVAQKDKVKESELKAQVAAVEKWYDDFNKKLASTLGDLVREAGKKANLSEKELDQYAKGIELDDKGKQRKADEAKRELYAKEVEVLREAVKTIPSI